VELVAGLAGEEDAPAVLDAVVLAGRAGDLHALVVLQFEACTADDSVAVVVGQLVAWLAGSLDALLASQGEAGRAGGQRAGSFGPGVALLAVLVAGSLVEAESFRALGQHAGRVDEGESAFDFALGGNALSVFDSPSFLAGQGDAVAVFEFVAFCAGDPLADSIDEDEALSAAVDGGDRGDGGAGGGCGGVGAVGAVGSVVVDGSLDADAVLQSPAGRALAHDALTVDEGESAAASDGDALAVLELLVVVADDAVARAVGLEGVACRTGGSDALAVLQFEVFGAFGSGAESIDELEAFLAVLVADAFDEFVAFWAADSDALALDELVVLVAGDRDAGVFDLVESGRAVLDDADAVDFFVVFGTEHLEALVVFHDGSCGTLDDQGLDALLVDQGEAFGAVGHRAGAVLELEAFFAGEPFAAERRFVESEVLGVAAADRVALALDEFLACRAADSHADVLLLLLAELEEEAFRTGDLGADSSVEELSDSALLDAGAVDQGEARRAGVDDAGLEGEVVLLVDRAADVGADAVVQEVARPALNSDALFSDEFLSPGALDLVALLVFEAEAGLAAGQFALLGRLVEGLAFSALEADASSGLDVASRTADLRDGDGLADAVLEGEACRTGDRNALSVDQFEAGVAAGSDALAVGQGEVLLAGGSGADAVDQLEVPGAVLDAAGDGHVESGVADVLLALSVDELEVGGTGDLLADAVDVLVSCGALDGDADAVLSLLSELALGEDALAVDEQVVGRAGDADALSVGQLEERSAGDPEAGAVGLSLEEPPAHGSAGVVEELEAGSAVHEDAPAFFEDHASVALGSDAGLLVGVPLEALVAADHEALAVLQTLAFGAGDSDAVALDQVEVLGAADGFAGAFEEDLAGGAGFGADGEGSDCLSGEAFGTLLVDAGAAVPDQSLAFVASGDALGASDSVAFGAADLHAVSFRVFLVADCAADGPAVSVRQGEACWAGSELADALGVDRLVLRTLDLVADVASADFSGAAGDLLADSVDELEAAVAGDRDALVALESGACRALVGGDDSFSGDGLDAVSVDLLESRWAAKNNDGFGLLADEAVLLPSSRTVLDALDVLVVVVASGTADLGGLFFGGAGRRLASAFGGDGRLPVDGLPRLLDDCGFSLVAGGAFGAGLGVLGRPGVAGRLVAA